MVRKELQCHREWPGMQDSKADGEASKAFGWVATALQVLR